MTDINKLKKAFSLAIPMEYRKLREGETVKRDDPVHFLEGFDKKGEDVFVHGTVLATSTIGGAGYRVQVVVDGKNYGWHPYYLVYLLERARVRIPRNRVCWDLAVPDPLQQDRLCVILECEPEGCGGSACRLVRVKVPIEDFLNTLGIDLVDGR